MVETRKDAAHSVAGGLGSFYVFHRMLILAVFLAWRNIRLQRGDTRGASRLAGFILFLDMLLWVCGASHVPTPHELGQLL